MPYVGGSSESGFINPKVVKDIKLQVNPQSSEVMLDTLEAMDV